MYSGLTHSPLKKPGLAAQGLGLQRSILLDRIPLLVSLGNIFRLGAGDRRRLLPTSSARACRNLTLDPFG